MEAETSHPWLPIVMSMKCSETYTRAWGHHAQSQNEDSYELTWYFQVHQEDKEKYISCGIRITSQGNIL
jgi:hypothetical protein